jgi:hypothetical protein
LYLRFLLVYSHLSTQAKWARLKQKVSNVRLHVYINNSGYIALENRIYIWRE